MREENHIYYETNASDNFVVQEQRDQTSAISEDVIDGLGFRDSHTRQLLIGNMPINPDENLVLKYGQTYRIQKGYHSGKSTLSVEPFDVVTKGDATPADIIKNKVAWVNGVRIVGELNTNELYSKGNAKSEDILEGKEAWVNRQKVVGTIPVNPTQNVVLYAGEEYKIPYGLQGGQSIVKTKSLAEQTQGTAKPEDITKGKSAWVNGDPIVGTASTFVEQLADATATPDDVKEGIVFYSYAGKAEGSVPEYANQPAKKLECAQSFTIPRGFHDGSWVIQTETLTAQTTADATEEDIRKGKTAWANGKLLQGTLIPVFAENTEATATEFDIAMGKTAWVNGELITGISPYDTLNFYQCLDNKADPTTPVIFNITEHRWDLVRGMHIDFIDIETDAIVVSRDISNYMSGSTYKLDNDEAEDIGSIVSAAGSPKITITQFDESMYIRVLLFGFTLIPGEVEEQLDEDQ